jgi:uncharacterized protein YfbU (UPF0304 family)
LIQFAGFDGNEEIEYFSYARFYLEELDRYHESQKKGSEYNTHHNILPTYRNMLEVWKDLGSKMKMEKEEIIKIIESR